MPAGLPGEPAGHQASLGEGAVGLALMIGGLSGDTGAARGFERLQTPGDRREECRFRMPSALGHV